MTRRPALPRHTMTRLLLAAPALFASSAPAAPASDPPPFTWPLSSMNTWRITAGFDLDPASSARADWTGWRLGEATAGNGHAYDGHTGIDIGVPTGTNVYATAAGTVSALRESAPDDDHSDTGNYIILNHSNVGGQAYQTRYWHLRYNGAIPAGTGVSVSKGQHIAYSGNTGNSTGPHLHYAIQLMNRNATCPFYHAWWENDEFYWGNQYPCLVYLSIDATGSLNCREGTSTGYNILTSFPFGAKVVATQRNGWWRVFLPLPPARAMESRTAAGTLAPGYSEAGSWSNASAKSTASEPADDANRTPLSGSGSRVSTFSTTGDAGDSATFTFTVPNQRGNYDLYATWPADANAANVTYRITDSNGTRDVLVNQTPADTGSAGTGTKADPYRIRANPYVVYHTTVGAPSQWNSYSPAGSGISQAGPERLYRFDLTAPGRVTIDVVHDGYPDKDVDIHLLTAASPSSCIARDDFTITQDLQPGTYYISVDTYQNNSRATPYTLRVEFQGAQPWANTWVHLGTAFYTPGATGSVQIREASVTGPVNPSLPGKVYADAIKIVPRLTRRTGWISDGAGFSSRIDMTVSPVPSVVIKTDKTAGYTSELIDEYVEVPIYASPAAGTANSSAIVGKAVTGQRFVMLGRSGDWYQVHLTNGTAATTGWILGDHLIAYRQNLISSVEDWSLY